MTRCAAAFFLAPHDVLMAQKRTAAGELVAPHTLTWSCLRCGRALGETVLWPPAIRAGPRRVWPFVARHATAQKRGTG